MNLNATLFAQLVVFFVLAWFTMKFVWPPIIKAIDERTRKIAEGLEFAEKSKLELKNVEQKAEKDLVKALEEIRSRLQESELRASEIIEEAKTTASEEALKIIEAAKKDASAEMMKIKEHIRKEVSILAIHGAEQILKKEIDQNAHDKILKEIEAEL